MEWAEKGVRKEDYVRPWLRRMERQERCGGYIVDPDWGHITIKISGHPPFPAQVMLNGHEYVACQARKVGIRFTKEANCFTHISDAAGLAKIAGTLSEQRTIGRLRRVCERWIYSTCLCFALDLDEQRLMERVSLPVLELSDRVQPQLAVRNRWTSGAGLPGSDRPQPRGAGPENHQDHRGLQTPAEISPAQEQALAMGSSGRETCVCMI
jgi:hypothetical protein